MAIKTQNSSKLPLRYERLHPGSTFKIVAEPSRGIRRVNDGQVYQRARDHEGFFATNIETGAAIILYPQDIVQPVKVVK